MYYIDLGAYNGGTIRKFQASKHYEPGTKIFAWECNPHLLRSDYGPDVKKVPAAAWTKNGYLTFYVSKFRPEKVQGSSFDYTKRTGKLDIENPLEVPCIDFSGWLFDLVESASIENYTTIEDTTLEETPPIEKEKIIVKMNIEGAEYPVLDHLIKTDAIKLIDTLIVKWHWNKIDTYSREYHNKLKARLKEITSLNLVQSYEWYDEK